VLAAQIGDGDAVRRGIDPLDRCLLRLTVFLQDADDLPFGKATALRALVLGFVRANFKLD
jgi:hypothetical protein